MSLIPPISNRSFRVQAWQLLTLLLFITGGTTHAAFGPEAMELMKDGKATEAVQMLEALADEEDSQAMVQLGIWYYQGNGVDKDYSKAMDWFIKAYELNNADAFVNLGVMHRDGQGVPQNKKIAYAVFLTTHMTGWGDFNTMSRNNDCLRRLIAEMPMEDVREILSTYTLTYIQAYLKSKGSLEGIPEAYAATQDQPALKDMGWFMDRELDAIFGPPSEKELQARQARRDAHAAARDALEHTLMYQIRFSDDQVKHYRSVHTITEGMMGATPLKTKNLKQDASGLIWENLLHLWDEENRYILLEGYDSDSLVFDLKLPQQLSPQDWSPWISADFSITMDTSFFGLMHGKEPQELNRQVSSASPQLRYKLIKE